MTVNTTNITSGPYTGNGVTTEFAYTFRIEAKTQVTVFESDENGNLTTLTVDTDYTVAGIGTDAGGTITRVAGALPSDYTWYVRSNYEDTQLTAFSSQGAFFPEVHEAALDKNTFLIQQIADGLSRSAKFPDSYSGAGTAALPEPAAGSLLRWNATHTGFDNVTAADFASVISQDLLFKRDTLAAAVADTSLESGWTVQLLGRITKGDGGDGMWSVVDSTSVTENGFNVVQCTGVATLSLVLLDQGIAHINRWGFVAGGTDNRLVGQALIDYATANSLTVTGVPGTYYFTKGTVGVDDEATALAYPCLLMSSNLFIDVPNGVAFKVADDQSSDVSDFNVPILYSIEQLENIAVIGLEFDSNYANNPVNATAHTWAQFGFSGSPTASTIAKGDNIHLERCKFRNNGGVNNILMSQSENTTGVVGKKWRVLYCDFEDNGYQTHDHSSIYGYAEDVIVAYCDFDELDLFGTQQIGGTDIGGQVAYEVHGKDTHFIFNKIRNYDQIAWIATNKINTTDNTLVMGNKGYVRDTGFAFYRETSPETAITNTMIYDNVVELSDASTAVGLKAAVVITASYAIDGVHVRGNTCIKTGTDESSTLVNLGPQSVASQKHTNITVENNKSVGTCFGVYGSTNATNGLGNVTIRNNDWEDLNDTAAFTAIAGVAMNVSGSNTIDFLAIHGNTCIDSAGNCDRGVYLEKGTITDLFYDGSNINKGMTDSNYTEGGSLTITNRHGTYPTVPLTPVWKSGGSAITVGNGSANLYSTKMGELLYLHARLIVGSTTTFPGGTISVDLIETAATSNIKYLGECLLIDGGTRLMHQVVIDGTGTSATLNQDGSTFITDTSPVTLTTGDELHISIPYRVVD